MPINLLFDLANYTPADASPLQANLQQIEQYLNQEVITRDGLVAMTAALRLANSTPVNPLDAASKGYVDNRPSVIAFVERLTPFNAPDPSEQLFSLAIPAIAAGHRCKIAFRCSLATHSGGGTNIGLLINTTPGADVIDNMIWGPSGTGVTYEAIVAGSRISGQNLVLTMVGGPGNIGIAGSASAPIQMWVEDLGVF